MTEHKPGTEVVDHEKLAAEMREKMRQKIGAPAGGKVKLLKSKQFKLPSGETSPGPMLVVVVDFVAYNAYFDRPYSEKEFTPPACFALGNVKPDQLVPSGASPVKQNADCKTCWANKFESDPKGGKGKACGNSYLLGCVPPNGNKDSDLYLVQVSSSSVKNWEHYVNVVLGTRTRKAPFEVITEISFDPSKDYQVLKFGEPKANPHAAIHLNRQPEIMQRLLSEPDVSGYAPPPARPAGPRSAVSK